MWGNAAVLSGDLAAMNAVAPQRGEGLVLVFRHVDGSWVQEAVLESPGGEEGTSFGASLALSGEVLVIGAARADSLAGAAYVFEPTSEGWLMTAELKSDGGPSFFGAEALVVGDDRILVAAGSPFDQAGTVTAFARQDGEWIETGSFAAFDGGAGDMFGSSMASDGSTLWIGAGGVNSRQGAIYEFTPDARWRLDIGQQDHSVPEPQPGDGMGRVVAHGGDILVSGMPGDDYGAGTATILEREGDGWGSGLSIMSEITGFDPVLGGQVDCSEGGASVFGCNDVDLVAFVPVSEMGGERGTRLNDIWGWTDPETQREYALVGRMDGTSFVDVTDPANPVVVGNLPKPAGVPGTSWRDMKVYSDHMFVVSDNAPASRYAGIRPHAAARLLGNHAHLRRGRPLRPDQQRPQHRHQPGDRLRLRRGQQRRRRHLRRRTPHDRHSGPEEPNLRGVLRRSEYRTRGNRLHP